MKILESLFYKKWFKKLSDNSTKITIIRRLIKIEHDNHFGDHKKLNNDIYELRFFIGGGIRIYFALRDEKLVLLLVGGDKSTQSKDIKKAHEILKEFDYG